MGHWYTEAGEARHGATDTDGLLPSVSEILSQLSAPALVDWRIGQALEAAEAAPRQKNETEKDFLTRVLAEGEKRLNDAATLGSGVHAAIEASLRGEAMPTEFIYFAAPAIEAFRAEGHEPTAIEEILVGNGYAGTMDMAFKGQDGRVGILDWKTKRTKPGMKPYKSETHGMQLAAYSMAHYCKVEGVRLINAYVSVTEPGRIEFIEHDETERLWNSFKALVELWWRRNRNQAPPRKRRPEMEIVEAITQYQEAKDELDAAEVKAKAARAALDECLGDLGEWHDDRWNLLKKKIAGRKTFVIENFAKDNPGLNLEPYYKVGADSYRLTIKEQEVMF